MRNGRCDEPARVFKSDESPVEQMIDRWSQEQSALSVQSLLPSLERMGVETNGSWLSAGSRKAGGEFLDFHRNSVFAASRAIVPVVASTQSSVFSPHRKMVLRTVNLRPVNARRAICSFVAQFVKNDPRQNVTTMIPQRSGSGAWSKKSVYTNTSKMKASNTAATRSF
jgi:hypothetical protein